MENIILTNDADLLICILYKEYLHRRKNGIDKAKAKYFGSSKIIHQELIPKWNFGDVDNTCRELTRKQLLCGMYADNILYSMAEITDDGIVYMENRFSNDLAGLLDYIGKIISAMPFI